MDININEIYENVKNDPSCLSSINIDALLDKIEKDDNDYLENKSLADISKDIYDSIKELDGMNSELLEKYYLRLSGYRYIDRVCDLRKGRNIRWIRRSNLNLTNGGILVNIRILDNVQIVCKNSGKFMSYNYDDCISFQQLTMEEKVILMSYDYINNSEKK